METVSVVVVTYNSAEFIEECVRAVASASQTEIVVVDNASTDETVAILRRLHQEGQIQVLIDSSTNDGFAKAVNVGIRASTGRDIFLLNPDAVIQGTDLEVLRARAASDPTIGIIAPLVDNGPRVRTIGAGRQPTLWPLFTHFSGLARAFPRVEPLRGRHLYQGSHVRADENVEWVSGCAMYIPRRTIERVGFLSERWFMYGEDIDYAKRTLDAGLRVVVTPSATAWHAIGASVDKGTTRVSTMWAENTYDYYATAFAPNWLQRFIWRGIFSVGLLSRAAISSVLAIGSNSSSHHRARARRFTAFARSVWRRSRDHAGSRPTPP